jgi:hypothetical protein
MELWRSIPLPVEQANMANTDYIIAFDETGTPSLKNLSIFSKTNNHQFTLSGVIFDKTTINNIAEKIITLKKSFWENGEYKNHRVLFHSRYMRKKEGPFNPKIIENAKFNTSLKKTLSDLPFEISSSSIDKLNHKLKYARPRPVYNLAMEFILERLTYRLNWLNSSGIIVLESRGMKEDKELLLQMVSILENGNKYVNNKDFNCIKGIYFNNKWTSDRHKSYWPLEIADIVSYSIHQHALNKDSPLYEIINKKIIGYPHVNGRGLKKFP